MDYRKKVLVFLVLLVTCLICANVGLVSAQYFDIRQGSEDLINFVVEWAEPFLQATLGGEDYYGYLLFEKFLLFLLLLGLVYAGISRVPAFEENKFIIWTISIIVPLLSVRFMNWEWLNTVLIQYEVLGIALTGILPFIIYLFFLHSVFENNPTGRKIGWIFFIVIYFGLWSTSFRESYAEVYFWTMLIALVFLILDGTIHRALMKQKWEGAQSSGIYKSIADIDKTIDIIEKSSMPQDVKKREIRKLERRRRYLIKHAH